MPTQPQDVNQQGSRLRQAASRTLKGSAAAARSLVFAVQLPFHDAMWAHQGQIRDRR
ncbi:hypothetical protein BQ8794_30236 [Mesorhizobium prunaredense]|uniref:Uncharacterized protein n=1 Tax=Mesorhizobium prunaredense TaxID=1631249 RepID=A0A1R3VA31_9HYPH|nr:hypothetical protein BQ8794_30236 [Mesorhizobium prunaredense]